MATKKKGGAKKESHRRWAEDRVPADRSSSGGRKTAAMMVEPAKGKLGVMVVGTGRRGHHNDRRR